ncbi:MAG TPA: sn-glycerol-3-phosphate ABC transporter ATP-binding protein UgpC [Kofleriaceae bacterium]
MAGIDLCGVTKEFPGGALAVSSLDLEVHDGEFLVLVGPSGSGKTTVLRMVGGLEEATSGEIRIGGRDVTGLAPRDRDIAMVFQTYALYPHMSVAQNMAFGLKLRKTPPAEIHRRVEETAALLGLSDLLDRKPRALSGGQRQRVAMGRAIVREPAAFLMDEPLSNLDAKLRVTVRAQLTQLHHRLGVTTVYVTHDQVEAMTLGHRVAVLRDGRLQQFDTPRAVFRDPANLFVAAFIGSPAMNFVPAVIAGGTVRFAGHTVALAPDSPLAAADRPVILGVRPTAFGPAGTPGGAELAVTPAVVEELGDERYVLFDLDAPRVDTEATRAAVAARSSDDALLLPDESRARFTIRLPADLALSIGQPVTVTVDPRRLYFFDPDTGSALR